jgi:signal transduction histidine kinase
VYDPFFRGGNTGDFHGHGIGLSLVQRIIKLHGGRTRIRSKVSEGTTVELTLPNLSGA